MTSSVLIICLLIGCATAVELSCSDNATCIQEVARDVLRSLRQRKAITLFDTVTIEPLARQARSTGGLWSLLENNAVSFDWSDFTFKVSMPEDGTDDALDLKMYESRTAAEAVPDQKKSSTKVEDDSAEDKAPKQHRIRRRQKKKVFQALIPMLFGMKTTGAAIIAFTVVTALTMKAFIASKLALMVTMGMAAKKLYETYSTGVGLQNHPYLYSQYPIDFPSASSHAYSVAGVSPQFASQEMYNPTAMAAQAHTHDILSQDARAQQSQQAPTQLFLNSTNAEQRWDGKSAILKYLEPIISTFKNVISPITNVLYGAMPTVRGLSSDVSTATNVEADAAEDIKKPKEFLVPQPRFIRAQRKNFRKTRNTPKKHTELKIDLDRLKHNKDLYDYIKTKKYKYNYPNTYYYPRIKYAINPSSFHSKPNNSRLIPYRKIQTSVSSTTTERYLPFVDTDWRPVLVPNNVVTQNSTNNLTGKYNNQGKKAMRRFFRKKSNLKRRKRIKRDLSDNLNSKQVYKNEKRGVFDIFSIVINDIMTLFERTNDYDHTKAYVGDSLKSRKVPAYYATAYNVLILSVDILDSLLGVGKDVHNYYSIGKKKATYKKIKKTKKQNKTSIPCRKYNENIDRNVDIINNTASGSEHANTTRIIVNSTAANESEQKDTTNILDVVSTHDVTESPKPDITKETENITV